MVPGYGYINIASVNINKSRNLAVLIRSYLSILQRLTGLVWCVILFFLTGTNQFRTSHRFTQLVIGFYYHSPFWLKGVGRRGNYWKRQRRRVDYWKCRDRTLYGRRFKSHPRYNMPALHIFKLKLNTGGVASKPFRLVPVFIYDNGLLLSDIIREDMQHVKPEFIYEDSDIKSAKT